MSSFSTFSPSFERTYCCFRRAPSFLCNQLNEIAADDSPAENILIGTETSPKEIVAEPRSEEHTSELQSRFELVCRLLLEKKKVEQRLAEILVQHAELEGGGGRDVGDVVIGRLAQHRQRLLDRLLLRRERDLERGLHRNLA